MMSERESNPLRVSTKTVEEELLDSQQHYSSKKTMAILDDDSSDDEENYSGNINKSRKGTFVSSSGHIS